MKLLILFILIAICLAAAVAQSREKPTSQEEKEFKEWMKKHKKKYASKGEENTAKQNWLMHKRDIDEHNQLYKQGKKEHKLMHNEHSDLTIEQMESRLLGLMYRPPVDDYDDEDNHGNGSNEMHGDNSTEVDGNDSNEGDDSESDEEYDENMRKNIRKGSARYNWTMPDYKKAPKSIDWRKKGLVTKVVNQSPCNSCWAFSIAGAMNAMIRKRNKNSKTLVSPQYMVDCIRDGFHRGCAYESDVQTTLIWLQENGIVDEKQYPWKGKDQECQTNNTKSKEAKINESYEVTLYGNETALELIVGNVGPVAVAICIEDDFWHFTGDKVYKHDGCCTFPRHGLTLVGYGTDKTGGDYWLLKNSWGPTWGDKGYMKMAKNYANTGNMCGVATYAAWTE